MRSPADQRRLPGAFLTLSFLCLPWACRAPDAAESRRELSELGRILEQVREADGLGKEKALAALRSFRCTAQCELKIVCLAGHHEHLDALKKLDEWKQGGAAAPVNAAELERVKAEVTAAKTKQDQCIAAEYSARRGSGLN